jgi:hypothetical protein
LFKDEESKAKYTEWNEDGFPTMVKVVENKEEKIVPVSNSQANKLKKELTTHTKLHSESAKYKGTWEKAEEQVQKFLKELAQE